MIGQALEGAGYAVRGARFLWARPRLWGWVVAPYLVTLALFAGAAWVVVRASFAVAAWATDWMPQAFSAIVGPLLGVVTTVGFTLVMLYVFLAVATIVAGPFCELLAEAAEQAHTGRRPPAFSVARFLADLVRTVAQELRRTLRYLLIIAVLGVVSIGVPGPGTVVAGIAGLWVAARFLAWDVLDWTLARRGLAYEAKARFLAQHRGVTSGLGLVLSALVAIPLVGAFALPVGAVAGMLLVTDLEAAEARPATRAPDA